MRLVRALAVPAVLALTLAGCATTTPDGAPPPTSPDSSTAAPATGAGTGDEDQGTASPSPQAPVPGPLDASVTTLSGAAFDPATIEGRPVVLWFWAPWCTICRAEAPDVAEVAAELTAAGSEVVLLGVPGRGETPEMADFVDSTGTGALTHLVDADGGLWRTYGVISQPAFALIGVDGTVEVVQGSLGADGLRAAVDNPNQP